MMSYKILINSIQKSIAQHNFLVKAAVKLRNQCNKIIGYSITTTHLPHLNGEEKILKCLGPTLSTVIDVGANKGEWTKLLKRYTKNNTICHLIEPGTKAFEYLTNSFSHVDSVRLHNIAFADANGILNFYEETNAGEQSSFVISDYHKDFTTIPVTIKTLNVFCTENDIQHIGFLKIDCEGYDYKVLLGSKELLELQKIEYIQFEYGSSWKIAGATLKAAILFLNQYGYEVYFITEKGLRSIDFDYLGEYFEYTNLFACKKGLPLPVLE